MSDTFQCGDNVALVSYLYDECDPAERAAIDAHIELCAACAAEIAALGSARLQLASWTPPEADLGFAIVRPHPSTIARGALSEVEGQAADPRPRGWARPEASESPDARGLRPGAWLRQPFPAWAQAVAACLIFGVGLWLGVLRGTPTPASPARVVPVTVETTAASGTVTATDLAALERRLRNEMATLRATPVSATGAVPQSASNAQLLAQVRALIDESEQRQQRELALRTAQVVREVDSQRRMDLLQIQNNFGQIEGLTGAEVRQQREMLNYLMRVSEQR
jgi:anti-sigma factor RsiW